ncbi:chromosome partition protein [Renibacterium salmoninarum ATCC 33209]|uniref:Chromosome partition protein n=1 Tax=Renibacterium salmoninarum (strain ATCC 33209 / DSM 20767 / JCM 11484 / NBRC 15589 / NCIMB 2235) TaxID=288705 RepID=A9WNL1_RENSM|nr:AAA family ATPase [Renibacterium salmoninarum]ABY23229.1 chromosome partition protein [Renibacterium salmoninarum ATCC 33209]
MKLHRLSLENFRGISARSLDFPETGAIVIEGENEVGKTSMIEALDLLITEKDSSNKAAVRAIKPVNADVGSSVEAEISTGPYRFVYRKQFNRTSSTTLKISKPSAVQLSGAEAHERVQTILAETLDQALWKALRMMQAQPLSQVALAESGSLTTALDRAAGTTADHEGNDPLITAIETEYLKYFTKTGKITGQYLALENQLESARAEVAKANSAVAEIALDVAKHESLTARIEQLGTQRSVTEEELVVLNEQIEGWHELERRQLEAAEASEAAQQLAERAEQDQLRRTELLESERKRASAAATLQTSIEQKSLESTRVATQLEHHQLSTNTLRQAADANRAISETARADVDHWQSGQETVRLSAQLTGLAKLAERIDAAHRTIAAQIVDAQLLAKIEKAKSAVDIAEATLRAASAQLTAQALSPEVNVEIDGIPLRISPAAEHEVSLSKAVEFVVPGIIKLVLRSAADAGQLATEVATATEELNTLLRQAKATDTAQARLKHLQRREADDELRSAQKERQRLLGTDDESTLRARFAQLETQQQSYLADREDSHPLPADEATAKSLRHDAESAERESRAAYDLGLTALTQYQSAWSAVQLELGIAQSELKVHEDELQKAQISIQQAREVVADEILAGNLKQAQENLTTAQLLERQFSTDLADSDLPNLRDRSQNAEELTLSLHQQIEQMRAVLTEAKARFEIAGSQGRQEALDVAESRLDHTEKKFKTVRARAQATKLLHEVMQKHRDFAKQQYVKPFQDQVNKLGRFVYGKDFSVDLNSNLQITTRTIGGLSIPYDALSAGAKEQLEIMARLACAAMVDPDDGVPLLIDDALGYSDPGRIRLLSALLGTVTASSEAQIFLFTCTPGRWSIGSATTIRLERETNAV